MSVLAIEFYGVVAPYGSFDCRKEAIAALKKIKAEGHSLILHTTLERNALHCAVRALEGAGVKLDGVNHNPAHKGAQHKPMADVYLDTKAFGAPSVSRSTGVIVWRTVAPKVSQLLSHLNV